MLKRILKIVGIVLAAFINPDEPRHEWVYRGESSRGVAAFLGLGHQVMKAATTADVPHGPVAIFTTSVDNTANNAIADKLVDEWRSAGVPLTTFEFSPEQDIPHNSIDPAADANKKQVVYDKILSMLGE